MLPPQDDVDGLVGEGRGVSSSALSERVLSQLLVELDGLRRRRDVVVVAATSRPEKLVGITFFCSFIIIVSSSSSSCLVINYLLIS